MGQARDWSRGDLWMADDSKPDPNGEPPHTGISGAMLVLYGLMALCAVFTAMPELIRVARGWALNTNAYPCVAGPGDQVVLYSSTSISSVTKGLWNGRATARLVDAVDPARQAPLTATSNTDTWGDQITIGSKQSKSSTITPWVTVQLPNDANLSGKPVKVLVDLTVNYPLYQGGGWNPATSSHHIETDLKLGAPGAGATYRTAWYMGAFGGGLLMLILGLALVFVTGALRNRAHPTEIFVPEKPEIAE